METQGQKLNRIRTGLKVQQKHLSLKTGITQCHLSRIENDLCGSTKKTLSKIASVLGIEFRELYVDKKHPQFIKNPIVDRYSIDGLIADESYLSAFFGTSDTGLIVWIRKTLITMRDEIRRNQTKS